MIREEETRDFLFMFDRERALPEAAILQMLVHVWSAETGLIHGRFHERPRFKGPAIQPRESDKRLWPLGSQAFKSIRPDACARAPAASLLL